MYAISRNLTILLGNSTKNTVVRASGLVWMEVGSVGKKVIKTSLTRFDLAAIDAGLKHMENTCRSHYFNIELCLVSALYVSLCY